MGGCLGCDDDVEVKLPPDQSDRIAGGKRGTDMLGQYPEGPPQQFPINWNTAVPPAPQKPQLYRETRAAAANTMKLDKTRGKRKQSPIILQSTSTISPPLESNIPVIPPIRSFQDPNPTFRGLNNIGNTCFANSILTCLYFIPELHRHFTCLKGATGLESALKQFYLYFQGRENTGELVAGVLRYMQEYDDRRQHSAFSFLNDLLVAIMQRKGGIDQVFTISIEEVCICTACQSMRSTEFKQETMSLALIAGELQGKIELFNATHFYHAQITGLSKDSMRFEGYKSAILRYFPTHKSPNFSKSTSFSLENSLKYALSTEICEGDSSIRCRSECDGDQTHLKQTFIRSLGPVFACYYERFNSPASRAPVSIPTVLNMREYAGNSGEYELIAMVNHSGNMETGHYTSLVKGSKGWFSFNDSIVKMQKKPNLSRSTEGIIAFYHRTS
jgi:ubiquitin C-terminal hydrolase